MKSVVIGILFFSCIVLGQTAIPKPAGAGAGDSLASVQVIGDFDGDGSNDVSTWWGANPFTVTFFSVYSFKKNQHLLTLPGIGYSVGSKDNNVGDMDNDKMVELIINSKIYKFAATDKKKVF